MLVVAEEEAVCALTLVAPHGVDAHLLAPAVVVRALVNICEDCRTTERERDKVNPGTTVKQIPIGFKNKSMIQKMSDERYDVRVGNVRLTRAYVHTQTRQTGSANRRLIKASEGGCAN